MSRGSLTIFLILVSFGIFACEQCFAANFLYQDKAGFFVYRCEGRLGRHKAKVKPQGWGHYQVVGPYIHDVIAAPDSFEAATVSCGENSIINLSSARLESTAPSSFFGN